MIFMVLYFYILVKLKIILFMNANRSFLLAVLMSLFFVACSPRMVGTWTVARYENVMPGSEAVMLSNIGTMTFYKNNKGNQDIRYQMFGAPSEIVTDFDWNRGANYISIKSADSNFAKTWIIIEDKGKKQVWKSTDPQGRIQTLELSR